MSSAFSAALYCENSAQETTCVGLCPNPDVGGFYALGAFLLQSVATSISVLWLRHPRDRRAAYYIQYFTTLAVVVSGVAFGNLGTINAYHGLLITYISQGTIANGAISLSTHLFTEPFSTHAIFHALLFWPLVALTILLSVMIRAYPITFGSQIPCNDVVLTTAPWGYLIVFAFFHTILSLPSLPSIRRGLCRIFGSRLRHHDEVMEVELVHTTLSTLTLPFYAFWIWSTYSLTQSLNIPILGSLEHTITQGQLTTMTLAFLSVLPLLKLAGDLIRFHVSRSDAKSISSSQAHRKANEAGYSRDLHPLTGLPLHSVYEVESFNLPETEAEVDVALHWQRYSSVDDYTRAPHATTFDNLPTPVTSEGDCTTPLIPLSRRVPRPTSIAYSPYPPNIASRGPSRSHTNHSGSSDEGRKTPTASDSRHPSPTPGSPPRLVTDDERAASTISQPETLTTVTIDSVLDDLSAQASSSSAVRHATPYRRASGKHTRSPSGGSVVSTPPPARSNAYRGLSRANSPPRLAHAIPELSGPYGPFSPMRRGSRGPYSPVAPKAKDVSGNDTP